MAAKKRQIIALGGGGFSDEDNPALDKYILDQTGQKEPRVCFLATATGDSNYYITRFYNAFNQLTSRPFHLSLFGSPMPDLENFLVEKDVIYVGGGNTRSMLALWREWDLPVILRKALENGAVLAGISAGAICWFEQGLSDSVAPGELGRLDCLGFISGSCAPHYDGEAERRPTYHRLIAQGQILPGYGIDDSAALHFVDLELAAAVSSKEGAGAYYVESIDGEVIERPVEVAYLGGG